MRRVLTLTTVALALFASEARAEIVVFRNGRTMSVKSCRVDGDNATMVLREGGEVTFPSAVVARVDPDEVPYPEAGNREPGTEGTESISVGRLPAPGSQLPVAGSRLPDEALAARPYATLISSVAAEN